MRQKMFKLFSIVLALVLCICCLSACGNDNNNNNGGNSTNEGYYVDEETGKIIDATTGETTDENLTVDETTGDIVDKETGEIVQTKEESDKIKEEATNPTETTKPQETTKPSETTKPENETNKEDKNDKTEDTNTSNPTETTKPSEPAETTCKHTETKVLNKTGATCDKVGYTGDIYCKKCNILISYGSHIQATGHKNTELRNAKEATTENEGYTGDTYCKDCKKTITNGSVIPKIQKVETPAEKRARTMAAATQKTSHQYYSTEMEILRLINIEREKGGLAPLEWYEDAYYFVKIRATEHLTPNGHTRPDGTSWHSVYYNNGVLTDSIAENLAGAVNYPTDNLLAKFAVEAWMNSPGHRAAIMNAKYTLTAISIIEVNGTIAIAQHFFN